MYEANIFQLVSDSASQRNEEYQMATTNADDEIPCISPEDKCKLLSAQISVTSISLSTNYKVISKDTDKRNK